MAEREYDIVLFGATGFTGGLTAEYLARHAPAGAKLALAGRNPAKLEAVAARLRQINPNLSNLPLLKADSTDKASLRTLAESTKVVVTTVGPYLKYGAPLVAACAAAGTGYLDLTGEPEFVDRMYLAHHDQAAETGARLIHAAGFDSIPHDLGVLYTVGQFSGQSPLKIAGFVRAGGVASGGTLASAVEAMSRLREAGKTAKDRNALERARWQANGRKVHGSVKGPHREPEAGGWVLPAPLIDPQIVLRSARALPEYGPDFSYGHYIVTGKARNAAVLAGGVGLLVAAAQTGPTRKLATRFLPDPGEGPSEERRAKSWFKVRFIAEGDNKRLLTQVSGGDPGYGETAKMLSEAAMCLAYDELPETSGQVTTAQALGQPLIDRLIAAGIEFKTL